MPLPPNLANCYEATQTIFAGPDEPCTMRDYECSEDSATATATATATDTGDAGTSTTGEPTTGASTTEEPTTGTPTTGATGSGQPYGDPNNYIACSGSTCLVDEDLLVLVEDDPAGLLEELTRLSFAERSGQVLGLIFQDVVTGSIADALGFHDGDIVLTVGGLPCTTEEALYEIGDYAWNASSVAVVFERGTSVQTRTFVRN